MKAFIHYLKKSSFFLILVFTLLGGFFRFYNLNWGAPYYFHPDERNIMGSITQLRFPDQMNPNFFAYGSVPIYTIYFLGVFVNVINTCVTGSLCPVLPLIAGHWNEPSIWNSINAVSFENAIIIARSISALFSILLIPLLYIIAKKIHSKKAGILAAFFTFTSIGFIQFAHFATFEMWLTFFSVILTWYAIKVSEENKIPDVLLMGVGLGILMGIKVSSLAIIPLPIIAILYGCIKEISYYHEKRNILKTLLLFIVSSLSVLMLASIMFLITNPFSLLDTKAFKDSLTYETNVATGSLPVFYTQSFFDSTPVIYQFEHIYPFLLNPLTTILFFPCFTFFFIKMKFEKKVSYLLILCMFFLLFLPQAFLFVKWTRYMLPTLPFIYLIISTILSDIIERAHKTRFLPYIQFTSSLIISVSLLYATAYFLTVYFQGDTRIKAAEWLQQNTTANQTAISETFDPGSIVFTNVFSKKIFCNFYDLEHEALPCEGLSVSEALERSTYILLPSERIMQSRLHNPKRFTKGYNFYHSLLSDKAHYYLVYKTPCDIFCRITYFGDPLSLYEQTAFVFDRPTIYIFQKL